MNRKERRAIGFTESRFRKIDMDEGKGRGWYDNAFRFYSKDIAFQLGNTTMQRTRRIDGKPRRWQLEKARRRLEQIDVVLA